MTKKARVRFTLSAAGLTLALVISATLAQAQSLPSDRGYRVGHRIAAGPRTSPDLGLQSLPNMGQQITPLAPTGASFGPLDLDLLDIPDWLVGHAVSTVVSPPPNQNTLLILTSGYNRYFSSESATAFYGPLSTEYVFVYDISTPATPVKKQILRINPNSYHGIVFDPSGTAFYVSGGPSDNIHIFTLTGGTPDARTWEESAESPLPLNHTGGNGLDLKANGIVPINQEVGVLPCAAGLAISQDGQTMVVANYYNDSITIFKGGLGHWAAVPGTNPQIPQLDLRPGKNNSAQSGVPGGEYPFWVAIKGSGASAIAYISAIRDREIVVVSLGDTPAVVQRIPVTGQPNKMTLNQAQSRLYVAEDQSDTVDVIDTASNAIVETIHVIAPELPSALAQQKYAGANPNNLALSPDETQLYVTSGNLNCVAVVALDGTNTNDRVVGLIPTGWYPNAIGFSSDGSTVYVVNGKSPTGPNGAFCYGGYGPPGGPTCMETNLYNPQLTKAGFQVFPRPTAQLAALTAQVAANDRFSYTDSKSDSAVMAAVRQGTRHVIFILRENRTYDQILGDLEVGNGDPALAEFGEAITPNVHKVARNFVTLDNFYDTAEVSYDGWMWSTAAQCPDLTEHQSPVAYAYRGLALDQGTNRSVNVAIKNLSDRMAADPFTSGDPDVLPGQNDVGAPDGPGNALNAGFLWDNARRQVPPLSIRNYGFFLDGTRYSTPYFTIPLVRNPALSNTTVAYSANPTLMPFTDQYFRGFDNNFPDYYRYTEWAREFDAMQPRARYGTQMHAPFAALNLIRLMHDHTGNFNTAIDGVNTPELMVADNDYAVGLVIQKVANSAYAQDTMIVVVEDDSQDGGDHVDSHRSVCFIVGAYVKQGVVISTQYNTLNLLRTLEEVLGLPPMNLNDALARPMADIFNTTPSPWTFTAIPSAMLYNTRLPLPPKRASLIVPKPAHDAAYWARATKGMDFTSEDRVDPAEFNRILWQGIMGAQAYPAQPGGADLRQNRKELLARYRQSLKSPAGAQSKAGTD